MYANLLQPWLIRCSKYVCTQVLLFICLSSSALQPAPEHDAIGVIDGSNLLREIASLPAHIKEASGLESTNGKHLWTHNDGGVPALYCLDTLGNLVRTIQLNHKNSGWEDLTIDSKRNLYVGGFGNNKNDKRLFKIYKIPDPENITEKVLTAAIIEFVYEDQKEFPPPPPNRNFDADAFIALGDSLFIFTKNRTSPFNGYSKVYRLPQEPGSYKAVVADSIFLGQGSMLDNWVTAAAMRPDGKVLVLLSHQCIWIIKDFVENKFSSGKIFRINFNHFSHKAGICFSDKTTLFIADELEFNMIGGKLYTVDLEGILSNLQ
jgi:hypothetical protein